MSPAAARSKTDGLLRDRRLLGLLISGGVVLLVISSVIGFSGAYFTSTSRSPGNEFAAAGMTLKLSVTGQIVAADGILPGQSRSGEQVVTNTGHRGLLVLDAVGLKSTRLSRALDLLVRRTDTDSPVEVYNGPLADMNPLELGTLEKDAARTYSFKVTLPSREDSPELSEDSVSFKFDWRLESLP